MQKIAKQIATLGGVGYFPAAPGTIASIIAVGIYLLIGKNSLLYFSIMPIALAIGFWASQASIKEFEVKDPPQVVIDEFSAMLLVYAFIPFKPAFIVAGFVLFRIFDIFKMPLIKKLEALPGGSGIMMDDIAAAVLTNLILQLSRILIDL
ncbi:MAG: phosphatidylglycerophosphatase A [Candidatus Omnitrophota bacterium]